jgi:hypothetical protein
VAKKHVFFNDLTYLEQPAVLVSARIAQNMQVMKIKSYQEIGGESIRQVGGVSNF